MEETHWQGAAEGGGLAKHVKNAETSGQERTEDEWGAEVELPIGQSQRPVCKRKPLNCYVEWILNGLQQVGPLKDVGGQGAHKDTETKIAEEGKNTAGKLFILSVR